MARMLLSRARSDLTLGADAGLPDVDGLDRLILPTVLVVRESS
jgi:hypothetical protein